MSGGKLAQPGGSFRVIAQGKLNDGRIQGALDLSVNRLRDLRLAALDAMGTPEEVEALRERAHRIRMEVVDDLEGQLARFTAAFEARGGHVHRAATAEDAQRIITGICLAAGAKLVAKSKSMATEEIALNGALEAAGLQVVETDLGEYILQLGGDHPVHIVAPAIEKTKEQIAEMFSAIEGVEIPAELNALAASARRQLREVFLAADVGITGCNMAVAETGSISLVTNEGNGRLVSSLPRTHIAVMGLERLVPTLDDLSVILRLLARSGTGQRLTSYTTLITGPRREGEADGPDDLHVVVLDNGRTNLLHGRYKEMLACIRCGACLNVCPVFRKTGGGAYGPVYSGPMGAVLVPLYVGLGDAPDLPHASSLCGACTEACPVKIPLHELLLDLRRDLVDQRVAPWWERWAFTLWSLAWSTPLGYRASTRLARHGQRWGGAAGPGKVWAAGRALPQLVHTPYRKRHHRG